MGFMDGMMPEAAHGGLPDVQALLSAAGQQDEVPQMPDGGAARGPAAVGECLGSHYVGDGSGCTWREVEQKRAINATCMYDRLDTNVEQHDPSCFNQCPQPLNHSSTCYDECYSQAARSMNKSALVRPWALAFESEDSADGGCTIVHTPSK